MKKVSMAAPQRPYEVSDTVWRRLEPHLLGRKGTWGGNAHDNRRFINAVFWVLRTGAPWRDLPLEYGDWKNTHRRFCRWRDKGVWEHLLELLAREPGYEWLMLGAGQPEALSQEAGRRGSSKYAWPWLRMVCRSESLLRTVSLLASHRG